MIWRILARIGRTALVTCALLAAVFAYAVFVEPHWLRVRQVALADSPTLRIVHITDLHYKGDEAYLRKVIRRVNATQADAVCFTGDLVEDAEYLDATLAALASVNKPLYGVPGNHDYWSHVSFAKIRECFRATGGDWLCDTNAWIRAGDVEIIGSTGVLPFPVSAPGERRPAKRVLLIHDPESIRHANGQSFDLILAGHTHGGQICVPFGGPLLRWLGVDVAPAGLSRSPVGPLYVNAGIGTFYLPLRFWCRPEIVIIAL